MRWIVGAALALLLLLVALFWRHDSPRADRAGRATSPANTSTPGEEPPTDSDSAPTPQGEREGDGAHADDSTIAVGLIDAATGRPIYSPQRIYVIEGDRERLMGMRLGTGSCRFGLPHSRDLVLRAEAGGYAPSTGVSVRLRPGERDRPLTIALVRYKNSMGRVEIVARTADGRPVVGASFSASVIGGRGRAGITAPHLPHFEGSRFEGLLLADRYEFVVSAPDDEPDDETSFPSYWLPTRLNMLVPGGGLARAVATLELGGRVIARFHPDIEEYTVQFTRVGVDPATFDREFADRTWFSEDDDARTLPPGRYRFTMDETNFELTAEVVAGQTTELDFRPLFKKAK